MLPGLLAHFRTGPAHDLRRTRYERREDLRRSPAWYSRRRVALPRPGGRRPARRSRNCVQPVTICPTASAISAGADGATVSGRVVALGRLGQAADAGSRSPGGPASTPSTAVLPNGSSVRDGTSRTSASARRGQMSGSKPRNCTQSARSPSSTCAAQAVFDDFVARVDRAEDVEAAPSMPRSRATAPPRWRRRCPCARTDARYRGDGPAPSIVARGGTAPRADRSRR